MVEDVCLVCVCCYTTLVSGLPVEKATCLKTPRVSGWKRRNKMSLYFRMTQIRPQISAYSKCLEGKDVVAVLDTNLSTHSDGGVTNRQQWSILWPIEPPHCEVSVTDPLHHGDVEIPAEETEESQTHEFLKGLNDYQKKSNCNHFYGYSCLICW